MSDPSFTFEAFSRGEDFGWMRIFHDGELLAEMTYEELQWLGKEISEIRWHRSDMPPWANVVSYP